LDTSALFGDADKMQERWWIDRRWNVSGPLGAVTAPLDAALDYIAPEPRFQTKA